MFHRRASGRPAVESNSKTSTGGNFVFFVRYFFPCLFLSFFLSFFFLSLFVCLFVLCVFFVCCLLYMFYWLFVRFFVHLSVCLFIHLLVCSIFLQSVYRLDNYIKTSFTVSLLKRGVYRQTDFWNSVM
jgi:hypothetical protein